MKISKCKNDHFVDSDKYSTCPICGAAVKDSSSSGGSFKITKSNKPANDPVSEPAPQKPVQVYQSVPVSITNNENEDEVVESKADEVIINNNVSAVADNSDNNVPGTSLASEIKQNSQNNAGKTVGFFQAANNTKANTTTQAPSPVTAQHQNAAVDVNGVDSGICGSCLNARDYVAGMLLCVYGPHFHECFAVCYGRNSIGRLSSNDIVLSKDNSVSREKHGWINYDPRTFEFSVQPGDSSQFMYLDDVAVKMPMTMSPYSKLELGDSVFFLFPFCGENFDWKNYENL